jgi:two-component system chemotaxis sensor kinase CheA
MILQGISMNEEELLKKLRAAFKMEASERLASISSSLLHLEKSFELGDENKETLDVVFREAHSLKGAARAVNYSDIETICQALEDVFSSIKRKEITFSPEMFDVFHSSLELIETLLNQSNRNHSSEINEIYKILEHIRLGIDSPKDISFATKKETDSKDNSQSSIHSKPEKINEAGHLSQIKSCHSEHEQTQTKSNADQIAHSLLASKPEENNSEEKSGPETISKEIPTEKKVTDPPPSQKVPPVEESPMPQKRDTTPKQSVAEVSINQSEKQAKQMPEVLTGSPHEKEKQINKQIDQDGREESVRISTRKLDSLLLKVEELVSLKLASGQHLKNLKETLLSFETWKKRWAHSESTFRWIRRKTRTDQYLNEQRDLEHLKKLESFLEWNQKHFRSLELRIKQMTDISEKDQRSLSIMIDDVLDDMKKMTMLPFSSLSQIFPKMIRDLCRQQSKIVDFQVIGNSVEIDRRILDELKDPMVHLLRNAVDHGIETTDERKQLQKPHRASLIMAISHTLGNKVEIVIEDDGKGIDLDRVRREAIKRGMITEKDADRLTEKENLSLIFRSELSTSPIITQISGRGLGLAIVQERIQKLGGTLTVESESGKKTVFRMLVPITLATSRGILVQLNDKLFVVPVTYVKRVLRVESETVKTVENKATITLEGEVLSFVSLADLLEMPLSEANEKKEHFTVVVLEVSGKNIACQVDEVLGEQEVLVKSLGKQLSRVRNIAGATILGSGKVVPMLNVHDLIRSSGQMTLTQPIVTEDDEIKITQGKSILVAEDSITSRMLIQNILESADYEVTTAVDGLDAYTTFKSGDFDLLVSDVEMPKMNGFELTQKIREDKQGAETPVVLVTSLQSSEDRKRGIDAGANAYIVKSNFDQSNLLEVIARLI